MKNDWYFNIYTANENFDEKEKMLIKEIDNAVLTSDYRIETEFGLGNIRDLSSGCKTLLNIIKNPNKIVCADECGKNVLDKIFAMDNIKIFMSKPERISISANTQICINDTDIVCGLSGYEKWWSEEYERREKDDI